MLVKTMGAGVVMVLLLLGNLVGRAWAVYLKFVPTPVYLYDELLWENPSHPSTDFSGSCCGFIDMCYGDFNEDKIIDLAVFRWSDQSILVGIGPIQRRTPFNVVWQGIQNPKNTNPVTSFGSIACADLNGDGAIDIVFSDASSPSLLSILQNRGAFNADNLFELPTHVQTAAFEAVAAALSSGASAIRLEDVNNDRLPDILIGAKGTAAVLIAPKWQYYPFLEDANDQFGAPLVVDLNRDGLVDVVFSSVINGDLYMRFGLPSGEFSQLASILVMKTLQGSVGYENDFIGTVNSKQAPLAVADMNEDGLLDIITSFQLSSNAMIIVVILQERPQKGYKGLNFHPPIVVDARHGSWFSIFDSALHLAVKDLDSDGRMEIVVGGYENLYMLSVVESDDTQVFLSPSMFFVQSAVSKENTFVYNAQPFILIDVDADSYDDLAFVSSGGIFLHMHDSNHVPPRRTQHSLYPVKRTIPEELFNSKLNKKVAIDLLIEKEIQPPIIRENGVSSNRILFLIMSAAASALFVRRYLQKSNKAVKWVYRWLALSS